MDIADILSMLERLLPDAGLEAAAAGDQPTLYVPPDRLEAVCRVLRDHPDLQFAFLAEVTAVDHWPREPRFEVVYHLARLGVPAAGRAAAPPPARLRLKVRLPGESARVPTISRLWPAADWSEREVWDLFGIVFDGHPDLRRILMPDEWDGHPLRKDYPVQVGVPVRTEQPIALTAEQFAANIEAARRPGRAAQDEGTAAAGSGGRREGGKATE